MPKNPKSSSRLDLFLRLPEPYLLYFFTKRLSLFVLLLAGIGPLSAQSVVTNGNLEQFTAGLPNNWTYTRGNGDTSIEQTSIKSPFTDFYSASTRSVLLHDANTSTGPQLKTSFANSTGAIQISFDFRLASGATSSSDYWFMELQGPTLTFNIIEIGVNGNFLLVDGSSSLSLGLTRDTWYQYSAILDTDNGTYSGSLAPFGGSGTSWSNRTAFNPTSISQMIVKDWTSGFQNPNLCLDNFYVSTVPEPGTTSLLVFGIAPVLFAVGIVKRIRKTPA